MHEGVGEAAVGVVGEEVVEELGHVEVRRHGEMQGGEHEWCWLLDDANFDVSRGRCSRGSIYLD